MDVNISSLLYFFTGSIDPFSHHMYWPWILEWEENDASCVDHFIPSLKSVKPLVVAVKDKYEASSSHPIKEKLSQLRVIRAETSLFYILFLSNWLFQNLTCPRLMFLVLFIVKENLLVQYWCQCNLFLAG